MQQDIIINSVMEKMRGSLTSEQMTLLEAALIVSTKDLIIVSDNPDAGRGWDWYVERFRTSKTLANCAEGSIEQYLLTIGEFRKTTDKDPERVRKEDIKAYLLLEERKINPRTGHPLSKNTLNNKLRNLSSFFAWMCNEEYMLRNPCRGIPAIRIPKKIRKAYTGAELERMREAADNPRDKALQYFLDATGCRISEAVSINREDINFETRSIIIYGSKGKAEREILFTEECAYHLRQYLLNRTDNDPALFVSLNKPHKRLSSDGAAKVIRQIGRKTGVKAHPHRFRRTMITRCNRRGMAMGEIQKLAGHVNPQTTQIYIDMDTRSVRSSYAKCI